MTSIAVQSVIAGRYRVLRELGRGGMGAVYLVEHVHTGEHLALKVLLSDHAPPPDAIERFKREARAPARIKSEHVVRVTDADVAAELGGAPFMVMEALQGKDLDAVVEERGALPPTFVSWILREIAGALDKAHSIGIIHRDLKPENLFLHTRDDGAEIVKILDFGISKIRDTDGGNMAGAGLTQTGAVMGTPLYMSPEQARGQGTSMGPGTDVWALGLVTLRLLSGDTYWHAETLADLLMKIMVEPMPPPSVRFPRLGTAFDAWFARSCERDIGRRFASVGEQVRAFSAIVDGPNANVATQVIPSRTVVLDAAGRSPSGQLQSALAVSAMPAVAQTGPRQEPPPRFQSTTGAGAFVHSSPALEPFAAKPASSGSKIVAIASLALLGVGGLAGGTALFVRSRAHATPSAASSGASAEAPAAANSASPPPAARDDAGPTSSAAPPPVPASATPESSSSSHGASALPPTTRRGSPPPAHREPATSPAVATPPAAATPSVPSPRPPASTTPPARPSSGPRFEPQAP
jgi:serine/threonine-protein kinase